MKESLSSVERKILAAIQKGLPRSKSPYAEVAQSVGISSEELLEILQGWKEQGILRRVGAIVNHFKIGLGAGAMVVWRVEEARVEEVGLILGGFASVSHAYERKTPENWPYNIYTMVHGSDEKEVQQTVEKMSEACSVSDYRMLLTERELKKAPPTYIT